MDRFDADALLAAAATALRDELLPHLSGRAKYIAAMTARSVALAHAFRANADDFAAIERAGLARIYGRPAAEDLAMARRQLAADIRAGKFPPDSPEEVRLVDHMLAMVSRRLRLTNAKYMVARQRSGRAESSV
jgi:Domain of unknown function (DUF6285)